jgi:predicted nucleotidyltransferase
MKWICEYCSAENVDFGMCVTEGCYGELRMGDIIKKEPIVIKYMTKYDVIFELVRQGAILTGSRAFGLEKEVSDWDFFVPLDFKLSVDFVLEAGTRYTDKNTARVYRHVAYPIHVQVVTDLNLKLKVQNLLLSMPKHMISIEDKGAQRKMWDWGFTQVS